MFELGFGGLAFAVVEIHQAVQQNFESVRSKEIVVAQIDGKRVRPKLVEDGEAWEEGT